MYVRLLQQSAPTVDWWCHVARVTADMLPDIVLLDVFDFYLNEALVEAWHTLVHVCRKWRNIAFGSPRRLALRLYCTPNTPVRETLDVWPLLPIVVQGCGVFDVDNIVVALEHNERICEIDLLGLLNSQLEEFMAAMQ
jgi:hypothetical protein